jgi:hypothetical protein
MKRANSYVQFAYLGLVLLFLGGNVLYRPEGSSPILPRTTLVRNPEQNLGGLVAGGLWQPDYALLKKNVGGLPAVRVSQQAGNSLRVALGQEPDWIFPGGRDPLALFLTGELWVARGSSPRIDGEMQRVAGIVAAYNQQLDTEGWTLIVVPVPTKLGVHSNWVRWPVAGADPLNKAPVARDRSSEVYDAFRSALDQRGVKNVDLNRVYRDALARDPEAILYPRNESHWSGLGITLAADATAKEIGSLTPLKPRKLTEPTYHVEQQIGDLVQAFDPLPSFTTRLRPIWSYEDKLMNGEKGRGYPYPSHPAGLVVSLGTSYTGQYTWIPEPVGFAGQLGLHLENAEVQNRPMAGQGSFKSFEHFWAHRKEIADEFASRQGAGKPLVVVWEMPLRDVPGVGESSLSWNQAHGWH